MKRIIETERLVLREYVQEDFDALYAILSDPVTMQHYPKPYDKDGTQRWLCWSFDNYQKHGFGLWAIELKATGEFIGDCGITMQPIDGEWLPEIGYHIHRDHWRRGYAKEAAAAVRDWYFANTAFDEVYSYMTCSNVASYSTAASIGMQRIKQYEDDGVPHYVYRLTRAQWQRPITTLFMLASVDGKISTGADDTLDVDKDYPNIPGVAEGLYQYYEIEQTTDLWSLNTGRTQAKIGANVKPMPQKTPVSFVLIDNHHLTEHGVRYFCALSDRFVLVTTNPKHPAFGVAAENMHIILQDALSLSDALANLKAELGCERLTVQSGGTLNALLLRERLIDYVDVVVAPVLVGGKDTPTIIDGASIMTESELSALGVLELQDCAVLEHSYLRLRYRVVHTMS